MLDFGLFVKRKHIWAIVRVYPVEQRIHKHDLFVRIKTNSSPGYLTVSGQMATA